MEDNKKPTFNVLFARGVVEQDYLEFLKKIFLFPFSIEAIYVLSKLHFDANVP